MVNPILPGFRPDPSICRVDDDFYLVTSTFEYFPGLPIQHSRDLVNWQLVGHALDRPEQLNLDGVRSSGGLYAPTIRWHRGVFYLVCTLVDPGPGRPGGNFVVTATDPAGPWSDPVWLGESESFDPSLFFSTDSADAEVWFCATRPDRAAPIEGGTEIWVRQFDLETRQLVGAEQVIWHGALVDAVWAEAPHLYAHPDGGVLLVIAEGGTAHDHAVTCARADQVSGPYRDNPRNPVLTHRHLGLSYPVVGAGHADLVTAADGTWWAVLLAMRPSMGDDGYHYVLGRETFLAEVTWEDGWPVFNAGVGALQADQPGPLVTPMPWPARPERDDFDRDHLGPHWSYLRTPPSPPDAVVSLTERPGWLALHPQPTGIEDVGCPAFISRPQDSWHFVASGLLDFTPRSGRETVSFEASGLEATGPEAAGPEAGDLRATGTDVAGILLRQNELHSLQLLLCAGPAGSRLARVIRRSDGANIVLAEHPVPDGPLRLSVIGAGLDYTFTVNDLLLATVDGRVLSTTVAGGFTGTMIGLYAAAPTRTPPVPTAFWSWFEYRSS